MSCKLFEIKSATAWCSKIYAMSQAAVQLRAIKWEPQKGLNYITLVQTCNDCRGCITREIKRQNWHTWKRVFLVEIFAYTNLYLEYKSFFIYIAGELSPNYAQLQPMNPTHVGDSSNCVVEVNEIALRLVSMLNNITWLYSTLGKTCCHPYVFEAPNGNLKSAFN